MDAVYLQNPLQTINELQSLNRENRQRVYQLHNLVDISFQLNSFFEEDRIIHTYLLNLFGFLSTKSVVVLTTRSATEKALKATYFQGISKQDAQKLCIEKTDPIVQHILENHQIVLSGQETQATDDFTYTRVVKSVGGAVMAPVVYRNVLLGMVIIGDKFNHKPFSGWELKLFSLLTNFMAVALSNAKIYTHLERVSLTDPLTGLFNRRYFENYLHKELARAERFNRPFSLVMMDIDNFKNFNDQLGHPAGDSLLKSIADIMAETARTSDIITRYGGEEFCIILPEITPDGAKIFSERLRHIIHAHPFENRNVQPEGRITISMGTASYPKNAQRVEDLIKKADTALYHAKRKGKNRVVVYEPQIENNDQLELGDTEIQE